MSVVSSAGNLATKLAKIISSILSGMGGGGPGNSSDSSEFLKRLMSKTDEVENCFDDGQPFEKAVTGLIKDSLELTAKSGAPLTLKGISSTLEGAMPGLLEKHGLEGLKGDYMLKNSAVVDSKIDKVVSTFMRVGGFELGGMASGVANELKSHLKGSVPQTPAQKSGLDMSEQIDAHLNVEHDLSPSQKPQGPSIGGPGQ
ncbi:hypothetical protein ACI2KR_07325 [Pseudomonas luteola]